MKNDKMIGNMGEPHELLCLNKEKGSETAGSQILHSYHLFLFLLPRSVQAGPVPVQVSFDFIVSDTGEC